MNTSLESDLEVAILRLAEAKGPDKSISPDDAAKHVAGVRDVDWHSLLQPVRRTAIRLALEGRLVILRKGKPADPNDFKGVYRLTLPRE
ncbi:DUF3253 domain-containing protein [Phreatobacter stygius]|uniref:DUF3253 domain-containing protein n=1 Tax=Phreatobacter stygius TaxID=1940610 RepID=A0A4D7B6K9_9HYPH|nr:DUF3253 domain-containing protein [Phreatobacter stygius]QCI68934.1 DUF3253 domain-containing protein [Phreatobacter stygius]